MSSRDLDLDAIAARVGPEFVADDAEARGRFLSWEADGLTGVATPAYVAGLRGRSRELLRRSVRLRSALMSPAVSVRARPPGGRRSGARRRAVRSSSRGSPSRQPDDPEPSLASPSRGVGRALPRVRGAA